MKINHTVFIGSYPKVGQCPRDERPEYAFIGRSNVGKSSLINMLAGRKEIARISKTPGKTQLLNYYLVNDEWYLVDLPGYGYAQISKRKRQEWERMIRAYLLNRMNLQCAFVLVDANIPPQQIDVEFINWLGEIRVPFVIVFTKTDRLRIQEKLESNLAAIRTELLQYWNELPQQFITSSRRGEGREEILSFIEQINANYDIE